MSPLSLSEYKNWVCLDCEKQIEELSKSKDFILFLLFSLLENCRKNDKDKHFFSELVRTFVLERDIGKKGKIAIRRLGVVSNTKFKTKDLFTENVLSSLSNLYKGEWSHLNEDQIGEKEYEETFLKNSSYSLLSKSLVVRMIFCLEDNLELITKHRLLGLFDSEDSFNSFDKEKIESLIKKNLLPESLEEKVKGTIDLFGLLLKRDCACKQWSISVQHLKGRFEYPPVSPICEKEVAIEVEKAPKMEELNKENSLENLEQQELKDSEMISSQEVDNNISSGGRYYFNFHSEEKKSSSSASSRKRKSENIGLDNLEEIDSMPLEKRDKNSENEISRLKQELSEVLGEKKSSKEIIQNKEEIIKTLSREIEEKQNLIVRIEQEKNELLSGQGIFNQQFLELNNQLKNQKDFLARKQQELETSNNQFENKQQEFEALNNQFENQKGLLIHKQQEVETLNSQLKNREDLLARNQQELETLNNQLEEIRLNNEQEKKEIDKSHREEVEEIQKKLYAYIGLFEQQKSINKFQEEEIARFERERNTAIDKLNEERENLLKKQEELETLEKKLIDAKNDFEQEFKKREERAEKEKSRLEKDKEEVVNFSEKLKNDLALSRSESTEQKEKNKRKDEIISNLKGKLEESEKYVQKTKELESSLLSAQSREKAILIRVGHLEEGKNCLLEELEEKELLVEETKKRCEEDFRKREDLLNEHIKKKEKELELYSKFFQEHEKEKKDFINQFGKMDEQIIKDWELKESNEVEKKTFCQVFKSLQKNISLIFEKEKRQLEEEKSNFLNESKEKLEKKENELKEKLEKAERNYNYLERSVYENNELKEKEKIFENAEKEGINKLLSEQRKNIKQLREQLFEEKKRADYVTKQRGLIIAVFSIILFFIFLGLFLFSLFSSDKRSNLKNKKNRLAKK